jgi:hypothetical protein
MHPLYNEKKSIQPKMDGTEGTLDRRLHLPHFLGHLKRTSDESDGVHLTYYDNNKVCIYIVMNAHENMYVCVYI